MKTHIILFQQLGENSTTERDPVTVWDGKVNLSETVSVCWSSDDNTLVAKDKYELRAVAMPEWLSPIEWLSNTTVWKWFVGFDGRLTWGEQICRTIAYSSWGEVAKLACIKLLNTHRFKSDFRRAMRDQLTLWLSKEPSERTFETPFSTKQWNALMDTWTIREAKRMSSELYRCRGVCTFKQYPVKVVQVSESFQRQFTARLGSDSHLLFVSWQTEDAEVIRAISGCNWVDFKVSAVGGDWDVSADPVFGVC
jgi:hypothetical protein